MKWRQVLKSPTKTPDQFWHIYVGHLSEVCSSRNSQVLDVKHVSMRAYASIRIFGCKLLRPNPPNQNKEFTNSLNLKLKSWSSFRHSYIQFLKWNQHVFLSLSLWFSTILCIGFTLAVLSWFLACLLKLADSLSNSSKFLWSWQLPIEVHSLLEFIYFYL